MSAALAIIAPLQCATNASSRTDPARSTAIPKAEINSKQLCGAPTTRGRPCKNALSRCSCSTHKAFHAVALQLPVCATKEVRIPSSSVGVVREPAGEKKVCDEQPAVKKEHSTGKFYTVNHQHILQGLPPPPADAAVVEPFAGQGDLLDWLVSVGHNRPVEAYDIEPHRKDIVQRDTLADPPEYKGKYMVTNPPYLARNQTKDKTYFDLYGANDLYQCFLSCLNTGDGCSGGVIILPVGFFSSPSDKTCRSAFMRRYRLLRVNYFEEQVFPNTTTTVVAFAFVRSADELVQQSVEWVRFPGGETHIFQVQAKHGWMVAGQVYRLPLKKGVTVSRYVGRALKKGQQLTNIHLHAIDSGKQDGRIRLEFDEQSAPFSDVESRAMATIVVKGRTLTSAEQLSVCSRFNQVLEQMRTETWSLFLSQFREFARKRITFALTYTIVQSVLS
jgi:hypothetical protein